jgi:hypothetical protein
MEHFKDATEVIGVKLSDEEVSKLEEKYVPPPVTAISVAVKR